MDFVSRLVLPEARRPMPPFGDRASAARWCLSMVVAGFAVSGCGGADASGGSDLGGSRDASSDLPDGSRNDMGAPRDMGSNPMVDAGVDEMDAGVDAGVDEMDAGVTPIRIVTSILGTIDEGGSAVNGIAYGSFVDALLDGIVASDGTTLVAIDATATPISNPEATVLEPGISLLLTGPGNLTRTYVLGFETLMNQTVLILDGQPIRFRTRFFTNTATEYIIVNTAPGGVGTHYCLHSGVSSGTYGPQDPGDIGICLELSTLADTDIQAGAYTNFSDFDFVFDITVTETSFSGRYHGFVRRNGGDNALIPIIGFMHSDRVESGGWGD